MDDRLRLLLEEAEKRKKRRVINQERKARFEKHDVKVLREFAGNCGASITFQETGGFLRARITGDELLISDMDRELKQLLLDEDISITFQVEQNLVVMEVVLRTFYVDIKR